MRSIPCWDVGDQSEGEWETHRAEARRTSLMCCYPPVGWTTIAHSYFIPPQCITLPNSTSWTLINNNKVSAYFHSITHTSFTEPTVFMFTVICCGLGDSTPDVSHDFRPMRMLRPSHFFSETFSQTPHKSHPTLWYCLIWFQCLSTVVTQCNWL